MEIVFEVGAHDRGGAFGPQDDVVPAAVFELEHFLLDEVGGLAEGTTEEAGVFDRRGAEFLIAVEAGQAAGGVLRRGPSPDVVTKKVGSPSYGLNSHSDVL